VTLEGIGGAPTPDLRDYEGLPDNPDLIVSNIPAASTFELNGDTLYASRSIDPTSKVTARSVRSSAATPTHRRPSPTRRSTECGKRSSPTGTRDRCRSPTRRSRISCRSTWTRRSFSRRPSLDPTAWHVNRNLRPEGLLSMNPGSDGGQTVPECSASRLDVHRIRRRWRHR